VVLLLNSIPLPLGHTQWQTDQARAEGPMMMQAAPTRLQKHMVDFTASKNDKFINSTVTAY